MIVIHLYRFYYMRIAHIFILYIHYCYEICCMLHNSM